VLCRIFGLILCLLFSAGFADASPWARGKRGVFLSLSGERDHEGNGYLGLYGEYGLSPRDTLGFELGRASGGESSAMIWWQRSLDQGAGPDRWVVSAGGGVLKRGGDYLPLAQVGVGWGRGWDALPLLRALHGGGWLSVEARYRVALRWKDGEAWSELASQGAGLFSYLTPEATAKAELTFGWHTTDTMMLINQLRFEDRTDTGFSASLATTVVRDLAGPVRLEVGAVLPLSGAGETAVRIGTWVEF